MDGDRLNILWDFDGTLIDTYPVFTKILKRILPPDIPEEVIYSQLKISFKHTISYFNLSNMQLKYYFSALDNLPAQEFKPFKGVLNILNYANKNIIMTHNDRSNVARILKFHDLESYFIDIVSSNDGFPRKPNHKAYEYIHRKHAIDLVIGDRSIDILPGKKLGIKTCLFQNKDIGADFYLNDYIDFFNVISSHHT